MADRIELLQQTARALLRARFLMAAALAVGGYALYRHPPLEEIGHRQIGLRLNRITGKTTALGEGVALVVPGVQSLRRYSLADRMYRPQRSSRADGPAPLQSSEGLSIGVDLTIRYALDPAKLQVMADKLPADIDTDLVEPLAQSVIYKVFTHYTVREIFSTKRQELHDTIIAELAPLLAANGIVLRNVLMGNVDLPPDYRAGMDKLLAVELQTEQMQYTLQLKEKQVKESELTAEADKVRREKEAEAAASEQIIAAKAQEEAMQHVLPFKQKQIEQRKLEAEAAKVARIKTAEGNAQARRIEAAGEADSRRQLADAETYRLEEVGKANSEQLARDGDVISKHPLLIQKIMADKLSDKVSVIIAPPPANGGFIGANLLGTPAHAATANAQEDAP